MKFVYFSPDPFTTKTAIKAHNYAFQYFGGRTQTILYDLDRVYVVSENLGISYSYPHLKNMLSV